MSRFNISDLPPKYAAQVAAQISRPLPVSPKLISESSKAIKSTSPLSLVPKLDKGPYKPKEAHYDPIRPAAPFGNSSPNPKPKQNLSLAALDADERETLYAGRVKVSITSYRRRLLDPDNLIPKWFLDACRHSKLIRGDSPEDITLEVSQQKVKHKEDERTEITITPVSDDHR